ncbi:Protein IQ-DOMAIN 31 [Camellia lanceoleosa]|uniref:Protein IQ-DOMAIN 31 n=1 Tax=Camellia lanceoleosa TaxID=1840588 RepID=A0ACC0FG86_9ERIC|nr:Protein IQ-DOMAIN 31 [Camellia lanceoleosa]
MLPQLFLLFNHILMIPQPIYVWALTLIYIFISVKSHFTTFISRKSHFTTFISLKSHFTTTFSLAPLIDGQNSKWFWGLFGLKKDHSPSQSAAKPSKRRWSFVKSCRERDRTPTKNTITDDAVDPSKHAIAAAEKITSSGRSNATTTTSAAYVSEWAVIAIQAHFRGHLGRATPEKFEPAISSKITKHDQSPMLLKRSSSKSIAQVMIHQDKAHNDWMGLDHKMDEGSWDRKWRHAKWFRGLFDLKKDHSPSQSAAKPPKRRWSFVKSHRERDRTPTKNTTTDDAVDSSKHAIAAAEKITSSGRSNATTATSAVYVSEWAVIAIQAHFRGHLARRALKGLVKLQALIRGHIVRKRTVDLVQIGPATPEKFEPAISSKITKHDQSPMLLKRSSSKSIARVMIHQDKAHNDWMGLDHKMDEGSWDRKRRHGLPLDQCNHSFSTSKDSTAHPTVPSPSSCEVHSLCPLKSMQGNTEESPFCTANNGPQFYSASSRSGSSKRGPFTPSKSDESRSNLSGHYPNFQGLRSSSLRVSANFANKAYLGSGRLERLGMPV